MYPKIKKCDVGAISETTYNTLRKLQTESTSIFRIQKSSTGGTPSGLSDIIDHIKACAKTVGMFDVEHQQLQNTKLMQQVFTNLAEANIQIVDFTQQMGKLLIELQSQLL